MEGLSTNRRRGMAALLLVVGALGLSGCGPNYSGEGNEFEIVGRVTDPGDNSLKVEVIEVKNARGEAAGWFDVDGEHQIHDNCECGSGFSTSHETPGHVENLLGKIIEPEEVGVGACVDIEGKIRADQEGKYSEDRPVYDVARLFDCVDLP